MTEKIKKLKELSIEIQHLRNYIEELIMKKHDLLDPEILTASRMLDVLLNEYDKLIIERITSEE